MAIYSENSKLALLKNLSNFFSGGEWNNWENSLFGSLRKSWLIERNLTSSSESFVRLRIAKLHGQDGTFAQIGQSDQ